MDITSFKRLLLENFPTDLPDASCLFEGVRIESGHEKLEFLTSVEWPELSIEMMSQMAGEFWQLSSVWMKYYLPTFMTFTSDLELEVQFFGKPPSQFAEITNEDQDTLIDCLFGYWCSMDNLIHRRFEIEDNCFYGLSSRQADLVEIWLQKMDFKALQKADIFPEGFDVSDECINNFIFLVKKHAI